MRAELVLSALNMAIATRKPDAVDGDREGAQTQGAEVCQDGQGRHGEGDEGAQAGGGDIAMPRPMRPGPAALQGRL